MLAYAPARGVIADVKEALLHSLDRQGVVTPAAEVRVQRGADALRLSGNAELAAELEGISCRVRTMHAALLGGRVNAHASGLLRLRKALDAL